MTTTERPAAPRSPLLRIALIIIVLIVVVAIVIFAGYAAFQASKNVPLAVEVFPGAAEIGTSGSGLGEDRLSYVVDSPAQEVGAFYQERLENCTQLADADSGQVSYRCMVDGSSFYVTQYTVVFIQPGEGAYAGQTVITMDRVWGQ